MKIQQQKLPFDHVVIDDMYTQDEMGLIWKEIDFLTPKMQSAESIGTAAVYEDGQLKKHANGLILDSVYTNRNISDILRLNRKLFSPEVVQAVSACHPFFEFINICNYDSTLLNCYGEGDYYNSHRDAAVLTAVTFFVTDGVTGGEFCFTDFDHKVEVKNNRTVIFPSVIKHAAGIVHTSKEGAHRYSMAQFLFMHCVS